MRLVTTVCLTESVGGAWGSIYDTDDPFEEGEKRRQEEDLVFSKDNEDPSVIDFDAYEHIPVSNTRSTLFKCVYLVMLLTNFAQYLEGAILLKIKSCRTIPKSATCTFFTLQNNPCSAYAGRPSQACFRGGMLQSVLASRTTSRESLSEYAT